MASWLAPGELEGEEIAGTPRRPQGGHDVNASSTRARRHRAEGAVDGYGRKGTNGGVSPRDQRQPIRLAGRHRRGHERELAEARQGVAHAQGLDTAFLSRLAPKHSIRRNGQTVLGHGDEWPFTQS